MRSPRLPPGLLPGTLVAALLLATTPASTQQPVAPAPDVLAPATSGGLEVVDWALAKLATHRRLMVIGAHPDDEDNALLTWVSRGLGGEAAYLSLSRGEGGQNLIGTELGVELGLVRTGELMAARRIEGTRQYFARAYDFGYTRSLEETFERWPREVLLEDTMRAIRRFKPQVIVAVFPADARAGHGQHQASGLVAREAFAAAREGREFPALDAEGLAPWKPAALFQRAWSREQATTGFDLGVLDPTTGRTLGQLAAASRSLHRSQDMGREQRIGRLRGGVVREAGTGAQGVDLFAGIGTELEAIADLLEDPSQASTVRAALRRASELALEVREVLTPVGVDRAVSRIAEIHGQIERAMEAVGFDSPSERVVSGLLDEKWFLSSRALAAAAGVMVDATVDRERVVAGDELELEVEHWSPGPVDSELVGVLLAGPLAEEEGPVWEEERSQRTGVMTFRSTITVAEDADPTIPYYLRRPRRFDLYDWSGALPLEMGEPRQAAPLTALIYVSIAGRQVILPREFVHRHADQASGEVRRPLRVVPALEVEVKPGLLLVNRTVAREQALDVFLKSNTERPLTGSVGVSSLVGRDLKDDDHELRFSLDESRREQAVRLPIVVPADTADGRYELAVEAVVDHGDVYARSVPALEYPHITPTPVPRGAGARLSVFALELPDVRRVGYVLGASDRTPAVLSALGLPVELLDAEDLARGDLTVFDAIVVGSRAYEIDPALTAANGRLLDYARAGGTLIVQYQQYQFVRGGYAPSPLSIARPHGRVTDETAAIRVLAPEHPVFHRPNVIGDADWRDWVQERGLYFGDSWDESYRPLLELADPGREPERGALLVAPVGRGVYVYTGLSFFRQLPAGVPGAIRLFANLLALENGS